MCKREEHFVSKEHCTLEKCNQMQIHYITLYFVSIGINRIYIVLVQTISVLYLIFQLMWIMEKVR